MFGKLETINSRPAPFRFYTAEELWTDEHTSLNTFNQIKATATYERNQLDHFWSPDEYYGFLNTFKYDQEKITLDKYTIIEKKRVHTVYDWLQFFSPESLRKEFEENGFQVEAFFSDVAGAAFSKDSPDMAIVAGKR